MDTGYATVTDLEARWHTLTETEKTQAKALLDDAAVLVDAYCERLHTVPIAKVAKVVCCLMVKRAMISNNAVGVKQQMETVGSFTQSYSWDNPSGNLYLTATERRTLVPSHQRAGSYEL